MVMAFLASSFHMKAQFWLFMAVFLALQKAGAQGYEIAWWTIAGGGARASAGDYELEGTIGQAVASAVSAGEWTLSAGFWQPDSSSPLLTIAPWLADGSLPMRPKIEPSILRFPNKLAFRIPALSRQRRAMLLKVTAAPSTPLVAFVSANAPSGGHDGADHPVQNRPHGWLAAQYDDQFPAYNNQPNRVFQSSGTLLYSDLAHGFPFQTDSDGMAKIYYYAPELSGQEVVTLSTADGRVSLSTNITVAVGASTGQSFVELPGTPNMNLVGQTYLGQSIHPNNHYGLPALVTALTALSINWAAQYQRDQHSLPGPQLPVNDMSLATGGEFDIPGQWHVDDVGKIHVGHKGHRVGLEVDIGDSAAYSAFKPFPESRTANQLWASTFSRLFQEEGWFDFLSEGPVYFHIIVTGNGAVAMAFPDPAQLLTRTWDRGMRTGTIRIPMENRGGLAADSVTLTTLYASGGVTISTPTMPYQIGAAAIRAPLYFDVQVSVPNGLKEFFLSGAGSANAGGVNFPFYGPSYFNKPVRVPSGPVEGPHQLTGPWWQLTLSDPDQAAVPGGTVVYHGSILNGAGEDIFLQDLDLQFSMPASPGSYQYILAPEFVATGGLIPTTGYTGPLVEIVWSSAPSPGAVGSGSLTLTAETSLNLPPVTATFSSAFEPQYLSIGLADTNVVVSWPIEGTNMVLESLTSLGDDYPEWDVIDNPVIISNGVNTVTLPQSDQSQFFQLVGPSSSTRSTR
jgi:hypothetical protein